MSTSRDTVCQSQRRVPSALRLARLTAGLTQAELGELTGRTREWIGKLEAGQGDPRWSTVIALAAALDRAPVDLFNDASPADEPGSVTTSAVVGDGRVER